MESTKRSSTTVPLETKERGGRVSEGRGGTGGLWRGAGKGAERGGDRGERTVELLGDR